jgi:hypothetical protein
MIGHSELELEALYGKPARFSEHQRGEAIRFRQIDGEELSGTIVWVCAPVLVSGLRLVYAVQVSDQEPVFVHPRDVLT